ncbi:MAG: GIY-YIG nuclease family protein [Candidatus Pacebacteria bacterium]|nr:GIY-YIG nuclease family protein [Candidatus Paceibacterota bacterium]
MYHVYIIECDGGTLYTGIATDVSRRFQEHCSGRGGAYTRARKAKKLLYAEECESRSSALKREAEIKSWPRDKKLALVEKAKNRN